VDAVGADDQVVALGGTTGEGDLDPIAGLGELDDLVVEADVGPRGLRRDDVVPDAHAVQHAPLRAA
jgi:hypothetical protein